MSAFHGSNVNKENRNRKWKTHLFTFSRLSNVPLKNTANKKKQRDHNRDTARQIFRIADGWLKQMEKMAVWMVCWTFGLTYFQTPSNHPTKLMDGLDGVQTVWDDWNKHRWLFPDGEKPSGWLKQIGPQYSIQKSLILIQLFDLQILLLKGNEHEVTALGYSSKTSLISVG